MLFFSTVSTIDEQHKADMGCVLNPAAAFETYSDMVYRLAYIRTGNKSDADDILSEVFLRLCKNKEKIKNEDHLKPWLIRVTVNCSNSFFKRTSRRRQSEYTEIDGVTVMEEKTVLPAVLSLPLHQKTVIYMHYFEGYSVEEIGKICGIATGTVKSRLSRARETLKTLLKGDFDDV